MNVEEALRELVRQVVREELAAMAARPPSPDLLHDVDQAAALLGIARTTLYGELAAGRLRSLKVGRRRLIPSSAIAEYIATARR